MKGRSGRRQEAGLNLGEGDHTTRGVKSSPEVISATGRMVQKKSPIQEFSLERDFGFLQDCRCFNKPVDYLAPISAPGKVHLIPEGHQKGDIFGGINSVKHPPGA